MIKRAAAVAAVGLGGLTGSASAASGSGRVQNPNEIPVNDVSMDRALTRTSTFYYTGQKPEINDSGVSVADASIVDQGGNRLIEVGARTYSEWNQAGSDLQTWEVTTDQGETFQMEWEEDIAESFIEFP
jgi:hypothetical protein